MVYEGRLDTGAARVYFNFVEPIDRGSINRGLEPIRSRYASLGILRVGTNHEAGNSSDIVTRSDCRLRENLFRNAG